MEARKNNYFIDGFFIRHFGIFPVGVDKDNFFYEQKIFLIYLLGNIPTLEFWQKDISYRNRTEDILLIDDIELSSAEISLANIHGTDIRELKKTRLSAHKKRLILELKKEYHIQVETEQDDSSDTELIQPSKETNQQSVWDILNGKGIKSSG